MSASQRFLPDLAHLTAFIVGTHKVQWLISIHIF